MTRQPSALTAAASSHEMVILDFDDAPGTAKKNHAPGPAQDAQAQRAAASKELEKAEQEIRRALLSARSVRRP